MLSQRYVYIRVCTYVYHIHYIYMYISVCMALSHVRRVTEPQVKLANSCAVLEITRQLYREAACRSSTNFKLRLSLAKKKCIYTVTNNLRPIALCFPRTSCSFFFLFFFFVCTNVPIFPSWNERDFLSRAQERRKTRRRCSIRLSPKCILLRILVSPHVTYSSSASPHFFVKLLSFVLQSRSVLYFLQFDFFRSFISTFHFRFSFLSISFFLFFSSLPPFFLFFSFSHLFVCLFVCLFCSVTPCSLSVFTLSRRSCRVLPRSFHLSLFVAFVFVQFSIHYSLYDVQAVLVAL